MKGAGDFLQRDFGDQGVNAPPTIGKRTDLVEKVPAWIEVQRGTPIYSGPGPSPSMVRTPSRNDVTPWRGRPRSHVGIADAPLGRRPAPSFDLGDDFLAVGPDQEFRKGEEMELALPFRIPVVLRPSCGLSHHAQPRAFRKIQANANGNCQFCAGRPIGKEASGVPRPSWRSNLESAILERRYRRQDGGGQPTLRRAAPPCRRRGPPRPSGPRRPGPAGTVWQSE